MSKQKPAANSHSRWVTIGTVAEKFNCSTRHISRLAASGAFPQPIHLGGLSRWNERDIERWLDAHRKPRRDAETRQTQDGVRRER